MSANTTAAASGTRGDTTSLDDAVDSAIGAVAPLMSPVQRLELSRARMRVFLEARKPGSATASPFSPSSIGSKITEWTDGLRANPVMGAVIDAVYNWWATHPLHSVASIAGDAFEDVAVPWIRRYPLAVVGGALTAGIVVSKIRPWRWLGKPALMAGLTSQIAAQLMTHAPLEYLIDAFTKFAKPKKSGVAPSTSTATTEPIVSPVNASADPQMSASSILNERVGIDPLSSTMKPVQPTVQSRAGESAAAL